MLNNHGKLDWNMNQLHNGCILAGIAHAIMVAHYPVVANEHSWDGLNYSVHDNAGSRGTVTFHKKYCVGAFYNGRTERATRDGFMTAIEYLWNAPIDVAETAELEAFQYLLDYMDGKEMPVITTAFWGDDKGLHTNDTYEDFLQYGGHLISRQAMNFNQAITEWMDEYEMDTQQVELLKSIFARKIENPDTNITLTKEEIESIGSDNPEGMEESKISFEELDIYWED